MTADGWKIKAVVKTLKRIWWKLEIVIIVCLKAAGCININVFVDVVVQFTATLTGD